MTFVSECCEDNCASYRGDLATTISGKDCIPWANLYSGDHWTAAKYDINFLHESLINHHLKSVELETLEITPKSISETTINVFLTLRLFFL